MGHISFVGKFDGATLSANAPGIAPGWTLDLMAKHSLDFWLTSEDLPDPENRVTLNRQGKIVLGYEAEALMNQFTKRLWRFMGVRKLCYDPSTRGIFRCGYARSAAQKQGALAGGA